MQQHLVVTRVPVSGPIWGTSRLSNVPRRKRERESIENYAYFHIPYVPSRNNGTVLRPVSREFGQVGGVGSSQAINSGPERAFKGEEQIFDQYDGLLMTATILGVAPFTVGRHFQRD